MLKLKHVMFSVQEPCEFPQITEPSSVVGSTVRVNGASLSLYCACSAAADPRQHNAVM